MAHNLTGMENEVKSAVDAPLDQLFAAHQRFLLRDLEVVRGVLYPGVDLAHPAVRAALRPWDGTRVSRPTPYGTELTLVRRVAPRLRERWWLHVLLLLGTLFSTTLAGAFLAGWMPRDFTLVSLGAVSIPIPAGMFLPELGPGLWFSLPMMAVLLAHELGHYALARRHGMDVSPPYFIPAPYFVSLIGTFGAFIRLRSPLVNRAALLDVGAAGPLAGFALALPAAALGLWMSGPLAADAVVEGPGRFFLAYGSDPLLPVGGSLGWHALAWLLAPAGPLVLHPVAVVGWVGFFFTALNLLPVSQLDGGHILYALFGKRQQAVGVAFLVALLGLGFWWSGWWVWAVLILILGRGRIGHPQVAFPEAGVGAARRRVGWACIALFVVTFIPLPFSL